MNIKIAQTIIIIIIIIITQNSWNFIVGRSSLLKKWQTSVIIREISDSNLETGRYGPKFVVSLDYPGELTAILLSPTCPAATSAYELFLIDSLLNLFSIIRRESFFTLSQTYLQQIANFVCIFSLLAIDTHISHFLELCLSVFIEVRFVFQDTKLIPSSNHVIKNSL